MPTVHYYGKKTTFVGKTLFEILANLKNFGVNRMVIKQEELLHNPNKKCYYIVKKVEPIMDEKLQEGAIYAERVYRDAKVPDLVFVDDESWHTDWQLVPKHQEHKYRINPEDLKEHGHPSTVAVLPRWLEVPPLMDVFLRRHYQMRGGISLAALKMSNPIQIQMSYPLDKMSKPHKLFRMAEEGEETDLNFNRPMKTLLAEQFRQKPGNN